MCRAGHPSPVESPSAANKNVALEQAPGLCNGGPSDRPIPYLCCSLRRSTSSYVLLDPHRLNVNPMTHTHTRTTPSTYHCLRPSRHRSLSNPGHITTPHPHNSPFPATQQPPYANALSSPVETLDSRTLNGLFRIPRIRERQVTIRNLGGLDESRTPFPQFRIRWRGRCVGDLGVLAQFIPCMGRGESTHGRRLRTMTWPISSRYS